MLSTLLSLCDCKICTTVLYNIKEPDFILLLCYAQSFVLSNYSLCDNNISISIFEVKFFSNIDFFQVEKWPFKKVCNTTIQHTK